MEISELRKALYKFAKATNACEDALEDILGIDSIKDFTYFLHEYNLEIDQRVRMKNYNVAKSMTPEMIRDYLESPFVADYDKNRVKEFINSVK